MKDIIGIFFKRPLKKALHALEEKRWSHEATAKAEKAFEQWVFERKFTQPAESMDTPLGEMGLTSSELSAFCKAKFGKNFLTVRKELRINEACRLMLEYPDIKIGEIGSMVGFSDPSNFRHQFKSVVGVTPLKWKENQKS